MSNGQFEPLFQKCSNYYSDVRVSPSDDPNNTIDQEEFIPLFSGSGVTIPGISEKRQANRDAVDNNGNRTTNTFVWDDFSLNNSDESKEVLWTEEQVNELINKEREESYEKGISEGYEKGHSDAMEALEADIHRLLLSLKTSSDEIIADRSAINEDLEQQFIEFVQQIVELIAPSIPETFFEEYLLSMTRDIARNLLNDKTLVFKVPKGKVTTLKDKISTALREEGYALKSEVRADANLKVGSARVEWESGCSELNLKKYADNIVNIVKNKRKVQ